MARLDPVIQRVLAEQDSAAIFQTAAPAELKMRTGSITLIKRALDTPQIVAVFMEIVPEALRASFPKEGSTRWVYTAPAGSALIQFLKRRDRVVATISAGAELPEGQDDVTDTGATVPPPPVELAPPTVANLRVVRAQASAAPPRAVPGDPALAMQHLLQLMLDRKASDLHLSSDNAPVFRIDGEMSPEADWSPIHPDRLEQMLWSITPAHNREEFRARNDADFAYELQQSRFRVNLFRDRKGMGAVLRHIPAKIRSAEELGLSKPILDLCKLQKGLVLVTGPTGSGKSTTLAAMIDHINRTRSDHIITIEDPVEFVHPNQQCLVNQREVGVHTSSFKQALRAALREDPDVILVGELRDLETISMAIETAETGHLVFATLHTNTAISTVDRIIDQFPSDRQAQVRTMLAESLKGVVAQTLCKKIGGGRAAALEVLLATGAVSNLIREGKTFQLASAMQTGRAAGMTTLNDSLLELVKKKIVEPKHALEKALHRAELRAAIERAGFKVEAEVDTTMPTANVA